MSAKILALSLLFFSTQLFCQNPTVSPSATPHTVFNAKIFWASIASQQVTTAWDGYETHWNIKHGGIEYDFPRGSSWLYGSHPSASRYAYTSEAVNAGTAIVGYAMMHSRKRWIRWLGIAVTNEQTIEHLDGAIYSTLNRVMPVSSINGTHAGAVK